MANTRTIVGLNCSIQSAARAERLRNGAAGPNRARCSGPWTATDDNTGDGGQFRSNAARRAQSFGGPLRAEPTNRGGLVPGW